MIMTADSNDPVQTGEGIYMFALLAGAAAGAGLPFQTSINANLNKRIGSPFAASLISFSVGTAFLTVLILFIEHGISIPFRSIAGEPVWIWLGGLFGVIYLTGNILLMPRLGSVQTVVFPVLGLVIMGLFIDNFGWFRSAQVSMSPTRLCGAALVIAGVAAVTMAKQKNAAAGTAKNKDGNDAMLWVWRLLGICTGAMSATQIAINGHLGKVIGDPLEAALISFSVGTVSIFVFLLILRPKINVHSSSEVRYPWWIWIGGTIGAMYVFCSSYIAPIIGTGMAVVVVQIGQMTGSLTIDHFGLVRSARKPITAVKVLGVVMMLIGAAVIHLL